MTSPVLFLIVLLAAIAYMVAWTRFIVERID